MKDFIEKYLEEATEEVALKLIHAKLHKILLNYNKSEGCTKDMLNFHAMVEDFLKAKGCELPLRK
ncbi:MAG TPA: hypothetical protein VN922_19360 [Bacteroidia bacterium]|nr:hypothetical protein [Bacteroidia bacterium]